MYQSSDPDRRTLPVTCYLDESGTHQSSTTAVVGGQVLNDKLLVKFERAWYDVLNRHKIDPPVHMKEFGRPHGRFASLPDEKRQALFGDIALVINQHKIYSIAVIVNQPEFFEFFSVKSYKHLLGPYGLAFAVCCLLNHQIAKAQQKDVRIGYLMDAGNPQKQHVTTAYEMLSKLQKPGETFHLGAFKVENDDRNTALQAADVIAWTSRKKAEFGTLSSGFEPLQNILKQYRTISGTRRVPHFNYLIPRGWIRQFAMALDEWLPGKRVGKESLDSFRKTIMPPF